MPNEPRFYLTPVQELVIKQNLAAAVSKHGAQLDAMVISPGLLKEIRTYKPGKVLYYAYVLGLKVYVDPRITGRTVYVVDSSRLTEDLFLTKVGGD